MMSISENRPYEPVLASYFQFVLPKRSLKRLPDKIDLREGANRVSQWPLQRSRCRWNNDIVIGYIVTLS